MVVPVQNFYKETVSKDVTFVGSGNIYVSTKPTVAPGILVISPNTASLREIIKYTSTGTDANGDYVVIANNSDRGLGGTTARTHTAKEYIRMNITAEHFAELVKDTVFTGDVTVPTPTNSYNPVTKAYADGLSNAGASDASTTTKGISRLSVAPDTTIGTATMTIASPCVVSFTAHGLTLNDIVKFSTTGALPTGVVAGTPYYVISTGLTANAFQISASQGGSAINTTGSQSGTHTLTKVTPVAVSPNDPKLPTQAENDAMISTSGTPSSTNKYVSENDTSNNASLVATTISFTNATKIIADSANGFVTAGFRVGSSITVSGTASNNGTFTITAVSAGSITIAESLVNESAGASMTLQTVIASKVVRYDTNGEIGLSYLRLFGDGSDGDVTVTTTITLTRDMFYNNLTISGSGLINSAGYKIFVKNTFDNTGLGIFNNGGNGGAGINGNTPGGAGGATGTLAGGYTGNNITYGPSGGGGGGNIFISARIINREGILNVNGGNGGSGTSQGLNTDVAGTAGVVSGTPVGLFGNTGGGGSNGAGGSTYSAGTVTASKISLKNALTLAPFFDFALGLPLVGGAGGGAGRYNIPTGVGGGGGGGGGSILVMYKTITTTGTPSYSGGTGGAGTGGYTAGANGTSGGILRVQIK